MELAKTNLRLLELADRAANKSCMTHRVGCVIASKGVTIGSGTNSRKTHPLANPCKYYTIHAELGAVLDSPRHLLKGATAFVVRVRSSGKRAMAKPCPHCQGILHTVGVKWVIFSGEGGEPEILRLR